MPALVPQLVAVALLVLLNGFFVAAEFALVKIRETQLLTLANKGHRRAKTALEIVGKLDTALSATQLGITIASLGLGWLGKPAFAALLAPLIRFLNVGQEEADWIAFAIGFSAITFLHIVAGELAPKSIAIQKPLVVSLWVAKPLQLFYRLFYSAIWALNHAAFWLLRRCGLEPISETQLAHSEEEIRLILAQNRSRTKRPSLGHDVALNAFELSKRLVREVMHPRHEITVLDTEATISGCMEVAERTRYSRFPLCEHGDLDKTLGVVHSKDLVSLRDKAKLGRDLQAVARKLLFVPETAHLDKVLGLLLERKAHMAIVVDEYGGTVGLVTLEDVLEALVGPIEDEFDEEKPLLRQTGCQSWELDGALPMHKVAELIGEPVEDSHQVSTVSGWILQRLGRFAKKGDTVCVCDWTLRVEAVAGTRISQLSLARAVPTPSRMAAQKRIVLLAS
jgi:CBS domain containing-hemolysin-like protein